MNNSVVVDNIVAADDIFGTSIKMLMGRTPRENMHHVRPIRIPLNIPLRYQNIILTGNIMEINKLLFLCDQATVY